MTNAQLRADITRHLRGALLLLRLDTRGFAWMDSSMAGARFSFMAALVALPLYLLLLTDMTVPENAGLRFALVHALAYLVQWTAMPLLLFYACQIIRRPAEWPRLVVPYNWLAFWQVFIYLLLSVVLALLPKVAAMPIMLGIGCYLMGVQGWVYARVLRTTPWLPLLLILLNVIIDWQLGMARYTLLATPAQ